MSHVAVRNSRAVQVHIAHPVVVTSADRTADVPAIQRVESHIEGDAGIRRPVAVDVLRSADASARRLVIGHHVAYRIFGNLETAIRAETPVALCFRYHESQAVFHQFRLALLLEVHA